MGIIEYLVIDPLPIYKYRRESMCDKGIPSVDRRHTHLRKLQLQNVSIFIMLWQKIAGYVSLSIRITNFDEHSSSERSLLRVSVSTSLHKHV